MIWTPVYLGIGSNVGDRLANLQAAIDALRADDVVRVEKISGVIETEPVGGVAQPLFLNAAIACLVSCSAVALHSLTQAIEASQGRDRSDELHWGPRTLDIDILAFAHHEIASSRLTIPHPRLAVRPFVLIPLAELAPRLLIPSIGQVDELCRVAGRDGTRPYREALT